jgi:hypothetical protein
MVACCRNVKKIVLLRLCLKPTVTESLKASQIRALFNMTNFNTISNPACNPVFVTFNSHRYLYTQMHHVVQSQSTVQVGDYIRLDFHHSRAFHRVRAVSPHGVPILIDGLLLGFYQYLQAPYSVVKFQDARNVQINEADAFQLWINDLKYAGTKLDCI